VFVHSSGTDGLAIAVAAKVNSIEHGYFMNSEILKRMADAQIAWVPTFAPVRFQLSRPEIAGWNQMAIANLDRILRLHGEQLVLALVPIIAGSDAGSPGVPHGSGRIDELHYMRETGLSLAAVIQSATGQPRRHWGTAIALGVGQKADLVLLRTSPFLNPGALREVLAVVKGDTALTVFAGDPARQSCSVAQEAHAQSATWDINREVQTAIRSKPYARRIARVRAGSRFQHLYPGLSDLPRWQIAERCLCSLPAALRNRRHRLADHGTPRRRAVGRGKPHLQFDRP
jgi:hypothetical protein